jgi:hypothetical protein
MKKVHGTLDWVHGDQFTGFTDFIKYRSSAFRSTVETKWTKGYFHDLIVAAGEAMNS